MGKTYKVYCHTCPNGKVYIGITGQDEKIRWNWGNGYTGQLFGRAVKKYGWKNIKHEIICVCETLEEAYEKEMSLIAEHDSTNPLHGYNCDKGGNGSTGHIVREDAREKISKRNKAKWSDESYRNKMLKHLREISDANVGRKRSKESIEMTISHTRKGVDQYSLSGEFIASYKSMMDAARKVGQKSNSKIVSCCKGKALTAHGFIWRYEGEPLNYDKYLERKNNWVKTVTQNAIKGAKNNCIPVHQMDKEGNILHTYPSMVEAGTATGIDKNNIGRCCNGYIKHAGNYVWRKAI